MKVSVCILQSGLTLSDFHHSHGIVCVEAFEVFINSPPRSNNVLSLDNDECYEVLIYDNKASR